MAAAMTSADKSPYAGRSPWVVDPDFTIWLPALRPVELEGGDLDLEAWADQTAGYYFAEGVPRNLDDFERIRRQLIIVGNQDFPSFDPWQDKWIHYPDSDDMPLPVMISDYDVEEDGSDDELRTYLGVGNSLVLEAPIVEEVHTAMGRGLRALAYTPLHEQGKVNICATLAYVWRVETDDDLSITRLWAMYDPTRILKAADDIHAFAMTLRLREE
jgi:hypothetical protein